MQGEVAIAQLEAYRRKWKSESDTSKRFIDFVSTNPDCFEWSLYDVRFAMQTVGSETYVVSDESYNLGWIRIEDLARTSHKPSATIPASRDDLRGFQSRQAGIARRTAKRP